MKPQYPGHLSFYIWDGNPWTLIAKIDGVDVWVCGEFRAGYLVWSEDTNDGILVHHNGELSFETNKKLRDNPRLLPLIDYVKAYFNLTS